MIVGAGALRLALVVRTMSSVLVNIDVPDLDRAIEFYARALGLRLGRRFGSGFAELLGAEVPIYLLESGAGSKPFKAASSGRDYGPHWTPLHLDFVVPDLDVALARALEAGAVCELEPSTHAYGRLAVLRDPFGHGLCLLQFEGRGYDALT